MNISYNKTKIVATVGPASNTKDMLRKLITGGVDVFRLNFSHGTHESHLPVIQHIKELREELGIYVSILQDLQGPKIRVEEVENNGVEIKEGDLIRITTEKVLGNSALVSTSYKALPNDVAIGDAILIDDGKLELKVTSKTDKEVVAKVIYGGILKSRKGINLPNTNVSAPSLTDKDYEDLIFGLQQNIDWVALSFVRTADDIQHLKNIISEKGSKARIVAKIEKPQAVKNIDSIIEVTDAIMVARGDLGVEILMEDVPLVQKMLVKKCNQAAKPVIVATQMLESMIENPRPTRAETNDVANAVMDGADAVMLSAESASGKYPELAVQSMSKIIRSIEENVDSIYDKNFEPDPKSVLFLSDSVIHSACVLAKNTKANAICTLTGTGYSAFTISRQRPKANIYIFSRNYELLNKLSLLWGVRGIYYERHKSTDETITDIEILLKKNGYLSPGELFITLASIPIEDRQRVNMMKISVAS
jgi:pyruvate kinase